MSDKDRFHCLLFISSALAMVGKERPKKGRFISSRDPLGDELHADRYAQEKQRRKVGEQRAKERGEDDEAVVDRAGFVLPGRATKRILEAARRHIEEDAEERRARRAEGDEEADDGDKDEVPMQLEGDGEGDDGTLEALHGAPEDNDDSSEVDLEYSDLGSQASDIPSQMGDVAEAMGEEYGIDDEESRLLAKFQPHTSVQSRNLADIIMQKIAEKEAKTKQETHVEGEEESQAGERGVDRRVAKVYGAIGNVLKNFTSGKIPKAFKVLPHVQGWEKLLMLTKPHEWSPHATYAATRIFAANLNERMAQRFYSAVLMPLVHERLTAEKKLHPALFMALRKALFKPLAFYKGFLLPLCQEGECTLREALVLSSLLQKCHLPPVPTAVVIVKLCELPFSGATSVFIRVLIDKKMALPLQCIDALVNYFHNFITSHPSAEPLPVLWHQTLLLFVTYYKPNLNPEQLQLLREVCNKHFHHLITPEIRREIAAAEGKKTYF